MCQLSGNVVSHYAGGVTDDPLIRNQSGTARERPVDQSVEELELETAIAHNVRRLRRQQGLSVGDMATRVGISKAMLSKIENGVISPSLNTMSALANALGVPLVQLFSGFEEPRDNLNPRK